MGYSSKDLNITEAAEAIARRRSVKKMFFEILKNSQENCARASFLIKLPAMPQACNFIKNETLAQVFSGEFCEFSKSTFFTEHLRWLLLKQTA